MSEGRIAAAGSEIAFLSATEVAAKISSNVFAEGSRYFLGVDIETREPFFAWDTHWVEELSDEEKAAGFSTVREIGSLLAERELELGLHALALSNWHRAHPRCPKCGGATRVDLGGAARFCDADQSQHHPRTDSAVIVLVKDRQDRILLGHQPI